MSCVTGLTLSITTSRIYLFQSGVTKLSPLRHHGGAHLFILQTCLEKLVTKPHDLIRGWEPPVIESAEDLKGHSTPAITPKKV